METSNAADLTVAPSSAVAKPEDKGPAPRYEGVAQVRGMFQGRAVITSAVPSGKPSAKPKLTKAELLARPLLADENEEEDESQVASLEEEAQKEAPPPPPFETQALVTAPPKEVVLPNIARQFLGLDTKARKENTKISYTESAVKSRMTDGIANTLITVGEQLEEMKLPGLDLEKGEGLVAQAEKVDGKTKFLFDNDLMFGEPITEEKLIQLDTLFKSLRIRMNYILGEGDFEEGSTSQLAKDMEMLFKLISYAPKFIKDQPKIQERQRIQAIKALMTPEIAKTLLDLETTLSELANAGITLSDLKLKDRTSASAPYVYEFEDDYTFLPVDKTRESRQEAELRLAELTPFFIGGTEFYLTKLVGMSPFDEENGPLQTDLAILSELFTYAKEFKEKQGKVKANAVAMAALAEERRAKTLAGTEYETLAKPIEAEMSKSPYEITTSSDYKPGTYRDKRGAEVTLPKQKGFIPSSRRAFGYFIYDKYRRYMLKAMEKLDPNACKALGDSSTVTQIYEYQKFVRDYISYMTPYRGVLVYHGLGSGKTCTAIAASEALLSSGGKRRIIVMTPFSLRKNFIQQITFCGFRHYRLLNYWTSHEYRASDGKNALWLFATSVLRIPESYLVPRKGKALRIWIPDLTKPQSEENYSSLPTDQQAEIREQIYETLVFDPSKGKNGLIWFLNYNGISASKLKDLACTPGIFDNSVLVIDEIHNLVRLMQGVIDPYLMKITKGEIESETKSSDKYLDPDRITSDRWRPKLCGKSMNYKRGYLFYRLLIGAKNTKIVGLSGTPLINFPEELGILATILHGYNFIYTASIPKISEANGNKRIEEGLKKMAEGLDATNFCPDIDFYEVVIEDRQAVINFTFTFLPEGYRKVQGELGVERIPFTETLETTEQKLAKVRGCITKLLKSINTAYEFKRAIVEKAEPLLPVLGEPTIPEKSLDDSFKGRFIDTDGVSIVNEQILMKRLSGLISYYKGSRKDLMPEVKKEDDVVVKVPMSLDQQKKYIAIRLAEIKIEEQKEKSRRGAPEGKGDDAELKKLSSSQNYRMASRQACNFVFPDGFTRPRPITADEAKQADEFGGSVEDLLGEDQAPEASALVRTPEEEARATATDRAEAEQASRDDDAISRQQEEEEIQTLRQTMRDRPEGEVQAAITAVRERYEQERVGGLVVAAEAPEATEELSEALTATQKRCLANVLPGETYQMALNRSKECLRTLGAPMLLLKDPARPEKSPLERWSPKYKLMLENIQDIAGSSLVYSQFLGMEGIGIFTIVLEANGYDGIKILSKDGQYMFDEKTEASIRKGPASGTNRFILFTGGEDENIRKINIDLFNAKFSELPPRIAQVLSESGFTSEIGNKRGELCRVFCITAAGAEGLSLKNVRGVHIMEPYWNDVRMAQVKGRAVRICSHQDLPLKDRNVKIYTYVTVFSTQAQETRGDPREGERMKWAIPQEIWNRDGITRAIATSYGIPTTRDTYAMTSDERLYYISERKKKLVENLIVIMKTAAADCLLNYKENMDGTFICRLVGNEGDFLYHPNLQKDIETNKNDDIGDLFKVPEAQLAEVRAAQAKLVFEEEKEEEKEEEEEEEKPKAKAEAEETKEETKEEVEERAPAPPKPAVVTATTATAPKPKRISLGIKVKKGTEEIIYVASAIPDATGVVDKFLLYARDDKTFSSPIGEAQAVFDAGKGMYLPKGGTAKLYKK
jgi:hypothetical protein